MLQYLATVTKRKLQVATPSNVKGEERGHACMHRGRCEKLSIDRSTTARPSSFLSRSMYDCNTVFGGECSASTDHQCNKNTRSARRENACADKRSRTSLLPPELWFSIGKYSNKSV